MKYITPHNHYFPLHHVRPRFKNDVENVLLYMATEIAKMPPSPKRVFIAALNKAIKLFPGNARLTDKTIDNWRTEIAALFGFIQEDNVAKIFKPGKIAIKLAAEQDLIQFFKYFLYYFQYPGGHVRADYVSEIIENGIKFKPAKYILKLLETGERKTGRRFFITKAELTHCVFNDLRVTRDCREPEEVIDLILSNRDSKMEYDWKGDVIRYAGDILDYMVLANLLTVHGSSFYLNLQERESIAAFIQSTNWFDKYDPIYEGNPTKPIRLIEDDWFEYVNTTLDESLFKTDIIKYLGIEPELYQEIVEQAFAELEEEVSLDEISRTKEIGDFGENIILGHEFMRVKLGNREDLIHLIKRIPSAFAIGYDIQSVELDARKRYIEVKTTVSVQKINFFNFHLTPNEWTTADTLGNRYFVYRLMLSKKENRLFVIQNPVDQYKQSRLKMIPRDGADVIFNEKVGTWTDVLLWQK